MQHDKHVVIITVDHTQKKQTKIYQFVCHSKVKGKKTLNYTILRQLFLFIIMY
jgi:hypothetical protein